MTAAIKNRLPVLPTAAAVCTVIFLLGSAAVTALSGASVFGGLLFAACAVGYIYLPGRFFSALSGMEKQLPGFQNALAILYGSGFFAILYAASVRLHLIWLVRLLPPVLGLVWLCFLAEKKPLRSWRRITENRSFWLLVLLWGFLCLLAAFSLGAKNPHPVAAGQVKLSADMLWNVGNANSFQLDFPSQDIRFFNVRFHYHYLTELLVSGLAMMSGQSTFDCLFYYAPPVVLAALLECARQMGLSFYRGDRRKSLVFVTGLFAFGCASLWNIYILGRSIYGNTMLEHLTTNINSQATALCFIAIFFVLFSEMARRQFRVNAVWIISWLCSFVLMTMSKGPQAAILMCSLLLTMLVVLIFQKPEYFRAVLSLAGAALVFGVVYTILFSSGANNSMHLNGFSLDTSPVYLTLSGLTDRLARLIPGSGRLWLALICVIHVFCMGPFQFTLWVRGLPDDVRHIFHLDAGRLLANGAVAGGMLAYSIFWHENSSQMYFALLGLIFMDLLAVDQLDRLNGRNWFALLGKLTCAVGVASALMLSSVLAGGGARQLVRTVTGQPAMQAGMVSAGDEEAALWLKQNSQPGDMFATNRIDSVPGGSDGISNVYSALCGRQAYMEGYTYAIYNMGVSAPVVKGRKAVNAALFSPRTDPARAVQLAVENGIEYIIYCADWPGSREALADMELCFESGNTAVYRVAG